MFQKDWTRDLHIRGAKLLVHNDKILCTERNSYLVLLDPENGDKIWETKVGTTYGCLTASENKVYYLTGEILLVINFENGKCEKKYLLESNYLGYVLIHGDYLITGAWRGYTDFKCYKMQDQLNLVWTKNTKSKHLVSYSTPCIIDNNVILINHSKGFLDTYDLYSGNPLSGTSIPKNLNTSDSGNNYHIENKQIYFNSKCGKIYSYHENENVWKIVITHNTGINSIHTRILKHQIIFQDSDNYICSYDKENEKLRWKFHSNHDIFLGIPVVELNSELTLIAWNMNKIMIVNKEGNIIEKLNSEKRFGSNFFIFENRIIYMNKSCIKSLTRM